MGYVNTPDNAYDVAVSGSYAYVADYGSCLNILPVQCETIGWTDATSGPPVFRLYPSYPNPIRSSTTISYEIPESSGAAKVVVAVYNIRGQKVVTLVDELKETGQYSVNWDGLDETGRRVSSGVYFYRMNAGDFTAVRKMVVLK